MSNENNSSQPQSENHNDLPPATSIPSYDPYHNSVCGSILHSLPSNSPLEIFAYLKHGRLDAFHRCFDIYHKDIIQMKNEHGQNVLHILTIHVHPYQWVRVLLMRGCDPCCQDNDGYTPAHYAIERDDIQMLKALTTRFHNQIKVIPEQQIIDIHQRCLKALSLRQNQGLTAFMLACSSQSIKCLDCLLEFNINDVHLQDHFGDTSLHYAVACRNEILVKKLLEQCNANVNSGDSSRPSVLDVLQFNREQQKPYDRIKDDLIEQLLLLKNATNRSHIRRILNKRKESSDNDESDIANLACLTVTSSINSQIQTARNFARLALSSETNGDINSAYEYYKRAMNSIPNDSLDWTDYAFNVALIHITRGENQLALDLLQQILTLRKRFENESEEIHKIQRAIISIEKRN